MRLLAILILVFSLPKLAAAADQDFEYRLAGPPKVTDRYASSKGRRYTIADIHANVYGGYADVSVLPGADCSEVGGQKFHFAWTFDSDITHLSWNKRVELRMMAEGGRPGPCREQNPFIAPSVEVLEINPILSEASARVFFDPKSAGRPNLGAVRTVRYLKGAAQSHPARLNLEMRGFSGQDMALGIDVSYSFQLVKPE